MNSTIVIADALTRLTNANMRKNAIRFIVLFVFDVVYILL